MNHCSSVRMRAHHGHCDMAIATRPVTLELLCESKFSTHTHIPSRPFAMIKARRSKRWQMICRKLWHSGHSAWVMYHCALCCLWINPRLQQTNVWLLHQWWRHDSCVAENHKAAEMQVPCALLSMPGYVTWIRPWFGQQLHTHRLYLHRITAKVITWLPS